MTSVEIQIELTRWDTQHCSFIFMLSYCTILLVLSLFIILVKNNIYNKKFKQIKLVINMENHKI